MLGQPREARDKKELLSGILRGSLTPRQEECGQVQIREVGWVRRKNSGAARRFPGSGKLGHGREGSLRPKGLVRFLLVAGWRKRKAGEALALGATVSTHLADEREVPSEEREGGLVEGEALPSGLGMWRRGDRGAEHSNWEC